MITLVKKPTTLPTMESFLNDFFGRNSFIDNYFDFTPKIKIKENETDYVMTMALPGFKKEDITINVEDDILVISSTVEKDDYKESFENKYQIPDDVDKNDINASMENGILNIKIGKYKEIPKTNIKKIDIM